VSPEALSARTVAVLNWPHRFVPSPLLRKMVRTPCWRAWATILEMLPPYARGSCHSHIPVPRKTGLPAPGAGAGAAVGGAPPVGVEPPLGVDPPDCAIAPAGASAATASSSAARPSRAA